jgi:hypothetical protein
MPILEMAGGDGVTIESWLLKNLGAQKVLFAQEPYQQVHLAKKLSCF